MLEDGDRGRAIAERTEDMESASLADVLDVLMKKWPDHFMASDVAE
jgi:hypothetical protein